ncbi:MAG: pilus assembly protein N-terminal domain-containing protein [Candidatus Melainabacteria bacterium]|nr:pilus assembly protein N-terminal domain-containing protein [Candidatus Melainabacteria bacterium]
MNKPQLSLAFSLSLVLLQANLLSAHAEPQGAIWQRMASSQAAGASKVSKPAQKVSSVKKAAPVTKSDSVDGSHAMLFLPAGSNAASPSTAMAIHSASPIDSATTAVAAPVASGAVSGATRPAAAQYAPDQVVAQAADQSTYVTAQPIPPVVTGTVELEEFKTTNAIDLKVSQSRTFKFKNKIVRTSISDPGIAEPVVVSENQMVLLGKAPGTCTMLLWDDAGNSISVDLRVSRDYTQLQTTLREIDPRIIVKAFSVGGSDRVLLTGDVDHTESIVKAFAASNVFMDDRGMNIQVVNSRIIAGKIGETGGAVTGGGQSGQLAQLSSVDKYTFFGNLANNIGKAQVMASDGGRVTSLVKVRKVPLIALHCSFMEMNTAAARSLALQLGIGYAGKYFSFGVGGTPGASSVISSATGLRYRQSMQGLGNPNAPTPINTAVVTLQPSQPNVFPGSQVYGTGGTVQPVAFLTPTSITGIGQGQLVGAANGLLSQAILLGAPGGAGVNLGSLFNLFTGVSNLGSISLNPTIQGIISNSRARVLAEPTLVTISGERASFLAGGEIPIVQQIATAGASLASVTFEPFGMRLNMIPVLQENGTINLQVSPEERIIAPNLAFSVGNALNTIPGFTTRKTQSIVELKPGQELYLSGLVTTNSARELTKTPLLGEVPVLGALYRSKAFNKNESELVICVRPEIILPGTPGQLKLPEDIGRVEGPRDTNIFQVEPTVVDERHYSSGRAERHQKTSPTLPEGAPIPDNE